MLTLKLLSLLFYSRTSILNMVIGRCLLFISLTLSLLEPVTSDSRVISKYYLANHMHRDISGDYLLPSKAGGLD